MYAKCNAKNIKKHISFNLRADETMLQGDATSVQHPCELSGEDIFV